MKTRIYKQKPKRAKWYMQYHGECPLCGKNKGYKEAQYTSKPKKWNQCHQFMGDAETYDGCEP